MLNRKEKTNFESTDSVNRLVEGTKIIGDIISESNIRIDGEVEGNITTSAKVVIGENGSLKGNLTCQEADIVLKSCRKNRKGIFRNLLDFQVLGYKWGRLSF